MTTTTGAAAVCAAYGACVAGQLLESQVVAVRLQFCAEGRILLNGSALSLFFFNPALFCHKETGNLIGLVGFAIFFSIFALKKIVRERAEGIGPFAQRGKRGERGGGKAAGFGAGFVEAEDTGVGGFSGVEVFPSAFAELFAGLRDVENVVDHLKGEAEVLPESGEGFELRGRGIGTHGPEAQGGGEEGGGFGLMNEAEVAQGGGFALALKVGHLPADEPAAAGAVGQLVNERSGGVAGSGPGGGDDLESERVQGRSSWISE